MAQNPCTWSTRIYRKDNPNQLTFDSFFLPFDGRLRRDNRWVILVEQIPWQQFEEAYGAFFSDDTGCPAKSARMTLGALLIAVEGKFGQGKRRFSLAQIMTKLAQTSEVSILITFLVMNLEKILTGIISFWLFIRWWLSIQQQESEKMLGGLSKPAVPTTA